MKAKILIFIILFISLFLFLLRMSYSYPDIEGFECRARLHTKSMESDCARNSVSDVLLSFNGDGSGYLHFSGSYSCQNSTLKNMNTIAKFNYTKVGGYYSINMKEKDSDLIELYEVFKYPEFRIKISEVNNNNYIISSPSNILLMCTKE